MMVVCETLPLCTDTVLTAQNESAFSEPIEVGPFEQGIVFVRAREVQGDASLDVKIGISPTGYEDWHGHWDVVETISGINDDKMHALRLSNFGNWLRLRFELEPISSSDKMTVLAWFAGDG